MPRSGAPVAVDNEARTNAARAAGKQPAIAKPRYWLPESVNWSIT